MRAQQILLFLLFLPRKRFGGEGRIILMCQLQWNCPLSLRSQVQCGRGRVLNRFILGRLPQEVGVPVVRLQEVMTMLLLKNSGITNLLLVLIPGVSESETMPITRIVYLGNPMLYHLTETWRLMYQLRGLQVPLGMQEVGVPKINGSKLQALMWRVGAMGENSLTKARD